MKISHSIIKLQESAESKSKKIIFSMCFDHLSWYKKNWFGRFKLVLFWIQTIKLMIIYLKFESNESGWVLLGHIFNPKIA